MTRAGFKHNFVGGAPAELVVDGKRSPYLATAIDDPDVIGRRMRAVLDDLGPKQGARALALTIEGDPTEAELAAYAAAQGYMLLDFEAA